jgi:hypothetical protein
MGVSKASLRGLRMNERLQKMRDAQQRKTISVIPANDDMRRLLRHPLAGGFRSDGSAEWPDDRFTQRRLADGDIKRAGAKPPEPEPPKPTGEQSQAEPEPSPAPQQTHPENEENSAA